MITNQQFAPVVPRRSTAIISLIIPVYNVEPYIAECLESALHQTFPLLEIICVDDRGTDNSMAIVERYAREDARIHIVRNAKNLGISASRNAGLAHSSAPFIMFLDSDDYYEPTMCEKMHQAIESSGADIAMCGTYISYESDDKLKKSDESYYAVRFTGKRAVNDEVVSACDVSVWNKIFRREFIERYEIRFPDGLKYEDSYFFNAYIAHARTILFVDEKLYHYRRREGSIMNLTFSRVSDDSIDHLKIAARLYDYYDKWYLLENKYVYFCQFFLRSLEFALRNSSLQGQTNIVLLAGDFAREKLNCNVSLPGVEAQVIECLKRARTPTSGVRRVRMEMGRFFIRYTLLGLTLYKIKYTSASQKHYLCGVQVYTKKHV